MNVAATLMPLAIVPDHPAFAGHFPGHPIVPGVVLLDEALRSLAATLGLSEGPLEVAVAKFLRPVRPGEPLWLSVKQTGERRYAIEVHVGQPPGEPSDAVGRDGRPELAATATLVWCAATEAGAP